MPVEQDLQVIAQGFISDGIASNYFLRDPLLWIMAAVTAANSKGKGLEIGRPGVATVFSGSPINSVQRMDLTNASSYKPVFQYQNPTNVKILGARDTAAQLTAATTGSQDQIYGTAEVRWTGCLQEQIIVWRESFFRAGQGRDSAVGRGLARATVVDRATRVATQNIYNKLTTELHTGAPTDQDWDPWDHFLGLSTWFSATNICARVDRSTAKNAQWRSNVDATARAPVFGDLLDVANIDYGLQDKGEGAMLCLCNNAQYKAFKAEALGKGAVEVVNKMPEMAQYGIQKELLRKDNCFIMRDPNIAASTCYFFDLRQWKFIVHPDYTFKVTPFRYLPEYAEAAKDAYQAFVELRAMLTCDNPGLQVAFTAITDPS